MWPTLSQAQAWRPAALLEVADAWDQAVDDLIARVDTVVHSVDSWSGEAADAAHQRAAVIAADGQALARSLVTAAVAARDGADQIAAAQADVLARVAAAHGEGFVVDEDGSVSVRADPPPLLVALSGGDPGLARDMQVVRAAELSSQIVDALERLGAADADAAHDIAEAFTSSSPGAGAAPTVPAAAWPAMNQDSIADQIAAMTPDQRVRLVAEFPRQVGNTDGVPWDMRVAANRINLAQAIIDTDDPIRVALYRSLLGEVDDPAGGRQRVDRQIVAFDPARASLVELNGDLATAKSVAVLVPGMNTTIEGSAANTRTARRFVSATGGDVATITYLGGPFPRGNPVTGWSMPRTRRMRWIWRRGWSRSAKMSTERPADAGHLHRPLLRRFDPRHRRGSGPDRRPDDVRGSGRRGRGRRRSKRLAQPQSARDCGSR